MDRIEKFLKKLSPKERLLAESLVSQILSGAIEGLDVKKLKGFADIYRVRKGKLRIIYRQNDAEVRLISISNRSEDTYRDF